MMTVEDILVRGVAFAAACIALMVVFGFVLIMVDKIRGRG